MLPIDGCIMIETSPPIPSHQIKMQIDSLEFVSVGRAESAVTRQSLTFSAVGERGRASHRHGPFHPCDNLVSRTCDDITAHAQH